MTPALRESLCFAVTLTGSYKYATQVANKRGGALDDSKLHALAQRVGANAEGQTQEWITTPATRR